MKKDDWIQLSPLLILTMSWLYALVNVLTSNNIFSTVHYLGLLAIVICIWMFFLSRRIYRYTMALTLLLGTFNLISFLNYSYWRIGFGVKITEEDSVGLYVNPFLFAVFLFFILLNKKNIGFQFQKSFGAGDSTSEERERILRAKIDTWKYDYADYSTDELEELYKDKDALVEGAGEAIQELLAERKA